MTCECCDAKRQGMFNFLCVACCVRHLSSLPDMDRVKAHMGMIGRLAMRRKDHGHIDAVKQAWAEFVENRRTTRINALKAILRKP